MTAFRSVFARCFVVPGDSREVLVRTSFFYFGGFLLAQNLVDV